ncbi:MAG: ribonuclease HII [Burkholderiaceae bacterium]
MCGSSGPGPGSDAVIRVGIDEVGRGPLAGPVTACAVALGDWRPAPPLALKDSKKISARRRETLAQQIQAHAVAVGLGWASVEEIDKLNILQATFLAMHRAVQGLVASLDGQEPVQLLVDGHLNPATHAQDLNWPWPTETCVGGDGLVAEISAASIVAKVARDTHMQELDHQYPGYGLASHAGYGTAQHLAALNSLGACPAHRRSFAPVARRVAESTHGL